MPLPRAYLWWLQQAMQGKMVHLLQVIWPPGLPLWVQVPWIAHSAVASSQAQEVPEQVYVYKHFYLTCPSNLNLPHGMCLIIILYSTM